MIMVMQTRSWREPNDHAGYVRMHLRLEGAPPANLRDAVAKVELSVYVVNAVCVTLEHVDETF